VFPRPGPLTLTVFKRPTSKGRDGIAEGKGRGKKGKGKKKRKGGEEGGRDGGKEGWRGPRKV